MKTFVVRLFVPLAPVPGGDGLHGVVEEVGSGRRGSFANGRQLLAFLETEPAADDAEASERSLQ